MLKKIFLWLYFKAERWSGVVRKVEKSLHADGYSRTEARKIISLYRTAAKHSYPHK